MKAQTVTIVGLGRTGSSVGLALKKADIGLQIVGHDVDNSLGRAALEKGAIDKTDWNLVSAAAKADILVLALPSSELADTLSVIGEDLQSHAVLLDLTRQKASGLALAGKYVKRGHYIGGRPVLAARMLKDGRTGIEAARPDLFQESVLCLTPSPDADPKAVETAVNFGRILGAAPYFVDPAEYDGLVQGVETIPGLMAAAMFDAVHGAAGWRDILRFADLPFAQVTAPLQTGPELARFAMRNRIAALRWLDALMSNLADVRSLIQEKDEERLEALVADLEQKRAAWLLEREENNWVEIQGADVGPPGLSEQMMGSWLSGRLRNED